jgi:regulator of protease activity HflC (stomatin/prohibitin superfamily)
LIDQLQVLISQGTTVPFTAYRLVRARDLEQLLERMRITVPSSIRESERTLAERDRIIHEARSEADRMIQQARQQAMEMLSEKALIATAQAEADRIILEGKEIARRRTEEADIYAVQVLQDLAQRLQALSHQVNNGLELMQDGQQILTEPPTQPERAPRKPPRFLPSKG